MLLLLERVLPLLPLEKGSSLWSSRSEASKNIDIKEVRVQVLVASISSSRVIVLNVVETHKNQEEQQINDPDVKNEWVVDWP